MRCRVLVDGMPLSFGRNVTVFRRCPTDTSGSVPRSPSTPWRAKSPKSTAVTGSTCRGCVFPCRRDPTVSASRETPRSSKRSSRSAQESRARSRSADEFYASASCRFKAPESGSYSSDCAFGWWRLATNKWTGRERSRRELQAQASPMDSTTSSMMSRTMSLPSLPVVLTASSKRDTS